MDYIDKANARIMMEHRQYLNERIEEMKSANIKFRFECGNYKHFKEEVNDQT